MQGSASHRTSERDMSSSRLAPLLTTYSRNFGLMSTRLPQQNEQLLMAFNLLHRIRQIRLLRLNHVVQQARNALKKDGKVFLILNAVEQLPVCVELWFLLLPSSRFPSFRFLLQPDSHTLSCLTLHFRLCPRMICCCVGRGRRRRRRAKSRSTKST